MGNIKKGSKKEEIEKLREEIELEELRVKREKQLAAQRYKSISKYSLLIFFLALVMGILYLNIGTDDEVWSIVFGVAFFGFLGYLLIKIAINKDKKESKHWELSKRLREKGEEDKKNP